MKIKISKGGTKKNQKNIMSLCENEKNQKGGRTDKKKPILSLYENENLKISISKSQNKGIT